MFKKIKRYKLYLLLTLMIVIYTAINVTSVCAIANNDVDKLIGQKYFFGSEESSNTFIDIINHWAEDDMKTLNYMDILKGFPDGTIGPSKTITRAEFVTMLIRAIELPITDTYMKYYNDIDASSWSYYHVSAAKQSGIIDIFDEEKFYPEKVITREEMAVIAATVIEVVPTSLSSISYKDIDSNYKYLDSIERVSSLGIIKGLPNETFNPKGSATRAEAAVIIQRILGIKDFGQEPMDDVLIEEAKTYELELIDGSNQTDYSLKLPLFMSIGKEKSLNMIRAEEVKYIRDSGLKINSTISNFTAKVEKKSIYLAEVVLEYNLKVEEDSIQVEYDVSKQVFLKRKGTKWVIYNSIPDYIITSNNQQDYTNQNNNSGQNDKINLTWHYMYNTTPNMSTSSKIVGLNVISPTWFTLTSGSGDIKSIGDIEYSKWAKGNGYKVWALATNDFDKSMTSEMLNSSQARKKFIDSLLLYAEKYQLDGINLDFENMYTKDKNVFTIFVKELYERATLQNLIISVDVTVITSNSNWSECYDRAELAKVSDYIMLMAYDQYWGGSPVSGSVAQLTWVEKNLKNVLKEVPKEKLVLGLPFYTRLWKEEYSVVENKVIVTSKAITMEAAELTIKENMLTKTWDEASGQYYASYVKNGATYKIWLEDERSIKLKTELVSKYNLAGVSSWRLGYERPQIWEAINDSLK